MPFSRHRLAEGDVADAQAPRLTTPWRCNGLKQSALVATRRAPWLAHGSIRLYCKQWDTTKGR